MPTPRRRRSRALPNLGEVTVILVAYRIPSLAFADQVVVLDRGRIVERGSHAELIARSRRYRGLVGAEGTEASR